MNNFVEYFYGLKVKKILFNNKYYSFISDNYNYRLYIYEDNLNIDFLVEINNNLVHKTLMSEIVLNKNNEIVSYYNGVAYILIKLFINSSKSISLDEILFLSGFLYKEKLNINWGLLWSKKIDYLEELINENGRKYPLIVDSFNYFVGMTENAISYFNSIKVEENYKYVLSHKVIKWDDKVDVLYNPLNITFDYRTRDVAEYIKNAFFNDNRNIYSEIIGFLQNSRLSLVEVKLLVSRLLYPSFYFDMYEDILIDNHEEKIILSIISKLDEYEDYLCKIISLLRRYYTIDEIEWLKKRRT